LYTIDYIFDVISVTFS